MSQILKFTVWFFKSTIFPSHAFEFFSFQNDRLHRNEHASPEGWRFLNSYPADYWEATERGAKIDLLREKRK